MYSYPQYIYPPTTVPVQRFFANPHVQMNRYDGLSGSSFLGIAPTWGGKLINAGRAIINDAGDFLNGGVGNKQWGLEDAAGNETGYFGVKGLTGGIMSGASTALNQGLLKLGTGNNNQGIGVGNGIAGVGNALGSVAEKFGPMGKMIGGIAKVGTGLIGGAVNGLLTGWHKDTAKAAALDADIASNNSTRFTTSSRKSLNNQLNDMDLTSNFGTVASGSSLFGRKAAQREQERYVNGLGSSRNYALVGAQLANDNITKQDMENRLLNYSAYGGYFDNPFSHPGSGAIAYGLEQQNLANQQQLLGQMQAQQNQPQMPFSGGGNTFGCGGNKYCLGGRFFAGGGAMNSHGADFTNGLVYIENGGTHEENPYQGVPMGYDQQGTPNVVEEDEVIAPKRLLGEGGATSDYVFSNRIPITDEFADKYHLPYGISVAKAVERLTKESRETPNDVIHENTNKKLLAEARDMQEQIKQQQQEEQQMAMQEAFAQMPPEQQQAIMQQQQMQAMEMPQQAPEQGQEMSALGVQEPAMGAFGGNLFSRGGYFRPVNMFYEGDNIKRGNRVREQYLNSREPWGETTGRQLIKQLNAELAAGADPATTFEKYNKLWHLAEAADMASYQSGDYRIGEPIGALQDYYGEIGLNNGITDELFTKYFDPEYQAGGTYDNSANGYKSDNAAGEITGYLRNLGIGAIPEDIATQLNDIASKYGYRYYRPDDSQYWRFAAQNDNASAATDAAPSTESEISAYDKLMGQLNSRDGKAGATSNKAWEPLDTSMRMAPIWASGIATLMDQLGITNTPDYAGVRQLERLAGQSRGFMPVSYKPAGQRMSYNPFDPYQRMIAQNALATASQRAIQDNSNGNAAMANASQVALNRNNAVAAGQLNLQDAQANLAQYERGLGFNRETDMANAQGIFGADAHNAQNWRLGQNTYNSLIANALELRQQEKQAADAARALNMSNFIKGLSSLGKENMYYNMVMGSPTAGGYSYDRSGMWSFRGNPRTNTTTPSMATNPFFRQVPQWSMTQVSDPAAKLQSKFSLMPENGYEWLQEPVQFFNYRG